MLAGERCFSRNRLLLLRAGVFWDAVCLGAILQVGTPWWCTPLATVFGVIGAALTITSAFYAHVCVSPLGQVRFRDFEWTQLRGVKHEFDLSDVKSVTRRYVWRRGDFLVLDYRKGGERKLNRSTWPKKDLLWLVDQVRLHVPDAGIAPRAEQYWTWRPKH